MIVPGERVIVNESLPNKDLNLLMKISVVMGLATLIALVTSYFEFYHSSVFRERAAMALELRLFGHIQHQPSLFFKNYDTGYVMSRITNDGSAAVEVVSMRATSAERLCCGRVDTASLPMPFWHAYHSRLVCCDDLVNTRTRDREAVRKNGSAGASLYRNRILRR